MTKCFEAKNWLFQARSKKVGFLGRDLFGTLARSTKSVLSTIYKGLQKFFFILRLDQHLS